MNWMTSLLFQCNSLDFSNSALACLPSMVTVHDCNGHNEKPNIDLRRKGGERGRRGGKDMTKATNGMLCGTLTRAMMITGAVKAQMKLVSYLNQHLKRKREGGRRKEGERERERKEGGREEEGRRERERKEGGC